jgi:catechol 2,3-dioxygenase-like lactoylglutathione lyase family enzyme
VERRVPVGGDLPTQGISDLAALLRSLEPELHDGTYAYCVVPHGADLSTFSPVATVAEAEGLTLIVPEEQAAAANLRVVFRAARITLTVHSDLDAVGLTAAFAGALGRAGVSCNVVAGTYHDHVFVPVDCAEEALAALRNLQQERMAQADIGGIAPFFIVRDVPAALAFYRDKLGFEVMFAGPPDDVFFGMVGRGGAMLMLKAIGVEPVPNYTRDVRKGSAPWDAYLHASDPDALAAEFASRNVQFLEPLHDDTDLRGFVLEDVDGYRLFFGRPL